jgi:hypothetical protein
MPCFAYALFRMEPEAQALRTSYHLGLYDEVLKEVKDIKSRRTENVEIYYFRALMVQARL